MLKSIYRQNFKCRLSNVFIINFQSRGSWETEGEHENKESGVRGRETRIRRTTKENQRSTKATLRAAAALCLQTVTGLYAAGDSRGYAKILLFFEVYNVRKET